MGVDQADMFDMGGGVDTLKIMSMKAGFDFTSFAKATGVEIIDATAANVTKLVISQELGAGSVTGDLIIRYGAAGISNLDTSRVSIANNIVLQGNNAQISLADGVNNRITLDPSTGVVVQGGSGHDFIRVRGGSAVMYGNDGHDTFFIGAAGAWTMQGGGGDDIFQFSNSDFIKGQAINGGTGFDEVRLNTSVTLSADNLSQVSGVERITFYGATNSLSVTDTLFDNRLEVHGSGGIRSAAIDISEMRSGKTLVVAENLSVTLYGDSEGHYSIEAVSGTNGTISGTAGHDTMTGGNAADTLYGNQGDDILSGGNGNDRLYGGEGNDLLTGGKGIDILYGGSGDDVFFINHSNDYGDVIKDFRHDILEHDTLDLSALFDANALGVVTAQMAFDNSYVTFEQSGLNTNVLFDRDGAG